MRDTILVVEDEEDTGDLLKALLEQDGFSVLLARDGRQASTLIETMRAPSLVLLDMIIPYMNGFEILNVIRHHPDWHSVPVLMLSADYYEPDIKRALREGATTYLVKQPGLPDLLRTIRQLLPTPVPTAPDQMVTESARPVAHKERTHLHHGVSKSRGKKPAA